MSTKKFVILHSNDMHGDFTAEAGGQAGDLIGGLALLSGYLNKVRSEEKNVLYVISGDMVQGSLIDSEYKGISTMEIMNYLSPDVVALGNHEFDYGLPHLLFLEKMANFPIVNANLYIKTYHKRLMNPYKILKVDGFDFLFTGIITQKVMDALKQDNLVGSFVTLEDAAAEVGKITNAYKNDDIDLTVLLTHIGYESDVELAGLLKPEWGVDLIIGGHSHTVLSAPAKVNNTLIAQAGVGTNQIGRFDIWVDDDTNSVVDYRWQLIPINSDLAPPDAVLSKLIADFGTQVDQKYSVLLTRFAAPLTHPARELETPLGDVVADAFAQASGADVVLVGSGSIRVKELGPALTLKDLLACFPYDDTLTRYTVTGSQLETIFKHIMRPQNRNGEGECYQVNSGVLAVYSDSSGLVSLTIGAQPVKRESVYTVLLQGYHFNNSESYLNITQSDLLALPPKVVSTSAFQVLEEYFRGCRNLAVPSLGRLVYQS